MQLNERDSLILASSFNDSINEPTAFRHPIRNWWALTFQPNRCVMSMEWIVTRYFFFPLGSRRLTIIDSLFIPTVRQQHWFIIDSIGFDSMFCFAMDPFHLLDRHQSLSWTLAQLEAIWLIERCRLSFWNVNLLQICNLNPSPFIIFIN